MPAKQTKPKIRAIKRIPTPFEIMLKVLKKHIQASPAEVVSELLDALYDEFYFIESPGDNLLIRIHELMEQKRLEVWCTMADGTSTDFEAISVSPNGDAIQVEFNPGSDYEVIEKKRRGTS